MQEHLCKTKYCLKSHHAHFNLASSLFAISLTLMILQWAKKQNGIEFYQILCFLSFHERLIHSHFTLKNRTRYSPYCQHWSNTITLSENLHLGNLHLLVCTFVCTGSKCSKRKGLVDSPTHVSRITVGLVWETILAEDDNVFKSLMIREAENIYAEESKPKTCWDT